MPQQRHNGPEPLAPEDLSHLRRAVDLSRRSLTDPGATPFGALLVVGGAVVGEGAGAVVRLHDPTAHAEIMALRAAGQALGRHLFEDGVLYSSSEPCPMCLTACYWARIPRVVYGAPSREVARNGFEDLRLYRELALPDERRALPATPAGGPTEAEAVSVLTSWAASLPEPVVPKL